MKISYIYRSPKLKAYSIENVFNSVSKEISKECDVERNYLPEPQYSVKAFLKNIRYASKIEADIFHITGDIHYICLGLQGKRTVLTVHDLRARERLKNKKIKRWIYELFWVKIPVRKCKAVTAISEYTKREILEVCPYAENKVVVVPDPINDLFCFEEKEFNTECPSLLFLGTNENKNHMRMIEAIKDIKCTVDIVGVVPDSEKELLDKYNIQYKNYHHISDEEMVQLYKNCDIVMFASTYEGFGMPVIEGQKTGRAILTSNISPMKDICGGGACLVDPYDVESIENGVYKLIHNAEYRNVLIEKGRNNAEFYTASSVSRQYLELYEKLTKSV